MEVNRDEFIWPESYRPHKIADCILPAALKDTFQKFVDKGELMHMMLTSGSGMGKTTVARAMCEEMGIEYILINGSEQSGIDTLRTVIKDFASTLSTEGGKHKVVIIDEADYLNPNSTQPALRGFMEEYSKNVRFIFTCNFKNRIIPPLHSRCTVIDFKIPKGERVDIASQFHKRLCEILDIEKIPYDKKVLAALITKHFPDFRRVLNELQRYSASGKIDEGVLANIVDTNMKPLITALKAKDWHKMRAWVVDNLDNDPVTLFRKFYDNLLGEVKVIPQLVIILNDYQYKAAFVSDMELNLVACLTEIMATCEMKQ